MRAGFGSGIATSRESLRYAQQLGATDIIPSTEGIPSIDGTWALQDLVKLRLRIEEYGMKLSAIENVPISFYDHIMLNGPRRDEQIEKMIITIRNMGRARNSHIRIPLDAVARVEDSRGCRSGAAPWPRRSTTK